MGKAFSARGLCEWIILWIEACDFQADVQTPDGFKTFSSRTLAYFFIYLIYCFIPIKNGNEAGEPYSVTHSSLQGGQDLDTNSQSRISFLCSPDSVNSQLQGPGVGARLLRWPQGLLCAAVSARGHVSGSHGGF